LVQLTSQSGREGNEPQGNEESTGFGADDSRPTTQTVIGTDKLGDPKAIEQVLNSSSTSRQGAGWQSEASTRALQTAYSPTRPSNVSFGPTGGAVSMNVAKGGALTTSATVPFPNTASLPSIFKTSTVSNPFKAKGVAFDSKDSLNSSGEHFSSLSSVGRESKSDDVTVTQSLVSQAVKPSPNVRHQTPSPDMDFTITDDQESTQCRDHDSVELDEERQRAGEKKRPPLVHCDFPY